MYFAASKACALGVLAYEKAFHWGILLKLPYVLCGF